MAITQTVLTSSANTTDATSWTTASISPTANRLVLAAVSSSLAAGPAVPTLTGNGLTWVQVNSRTYAGNRRVTVFRAMGASPTTGTVVIDFAGVTQLAAAWIFSEYDGVDTSGTNGSGAIVQSVIATGTSAAPAATLAAFGSTSNATYGAFSVNNTSGFTGEFAEVADVNVSGLGSLMAEWRNDNDTSVTATCTSGDWGVVAIEIKAGAASLTSSPADTLTLSDAVSTAKTIPKSVTDTLVLADTTARVKAIPKSIADTLTLVDATARVKTIPKTLTDSIVLTDSATRAVVIARTLADTLTLADLLASAKDKAVSISDSLVLTDALSRVVAYARTQPDALALLDEVLMARGVSLADALAIADAIVSTRGQSMTLADIVALTDTIHPRTLMDAIYTGRLGETYTGDVADTVRGDISDTVAGLVEEDE